MTPSHLAVGGAGVGDAGAGASDTSGKLSDSYFASLDPNSLHSLNDVDPTRVAEYAEIFDSSFDNAKLYAARALRLLLSDVPDNISQVFSAMVNSSIIYSILDYINQHTANVDSVNNETCIFECTWVLTNLFSTVFSVDYIDEETYYDVIQALCNHISVSTNVQIRAQIIWCISNIVSDGISYRQDALHYGILDSAISIFKHFFDLECWSELLDVSFIFANLCRNKPHPSPAVLKQIKEEILELVFYHIDNDNSELIHNSESFKSVVIELCHCLLFLTDEISEVVEFFNKKFVTTIYFMFTQFDFVKPILIKVFGNFFSGDSWINDFLVEGGLVVKLIEELVEITEADNSKVNLKSLLWVFSNMLADSAHNIEICLDHQLDSTLLGLFHSNQELRIHKELLFCFINIVEVGTSSQVFKVVSGGLLEALINKINHFDDASSFELSFTIITFVMRRNIEFSTEQVQSLKNILRFGEIVEFFATLEQNFIEHPIPDVETVVEEISTLYNELVG
ncbi:hypothetical protein P9112_004360 [Eukaryota sp. TZLM1-RC]